VLPPDPIATDAERRSDYIARGVDPCCQRGRTDKPERRCNDPAPRQTGPQG
jgi:hypothetical protein